MSIRQTITFRDDTGAWYMHVKWDNTLEVDFKCFDDEFETSNPRIYNVSEDITGIEHSCEYVHLTLKDKRVVQLKFEHNGAFIGDIIGVDGEHEDTFACHDFWDDCKNI